jgi:hypothetical protein
MPFFLTLPSPSGRVCVFYFVISPYIYSHKKSEIFSLCVKSVNFLPGRIFYNFFHLNKIVCYQVVLSEFIIIKSVKKTSLSSSRQK